jgi:uncharacterized protein (TIGR04141 family)
MSDPPKDPTHLLSVYLMRKDAKGPKDIFKESLDLITNQVDLGVCSGVLYVQQATTRTPHWARLFGSAIDLKKLRVGVSGSSAVLLVKLDKRTLAVTFGNGRHLLNPQAFEEYFGLHATLNTVSREQIRAVERRRFDALARHTREQASRRVPLADFGIDMELDLIRALTGPPADPALGKRISGKDSLSISVSTDLPKLGALLKEYLKAGLDSAYQAHFAEVGNILEVKDKRDELNNSLLQRIQGEQLDRMWLAVPEVIDWADVSGFRYSRSASTDLLSDIHFQTYFAYVGQPADVTIHDLKRHQVVCYSASSDAPSYSWPVYKCIYAELDTAEGTFLLDYGRWFRIDTDLVAKVNSEIDSIPHTQLSLPSFAANMNES